MIKDNFSCKDKNEYLCFRNKFYSNDDIELFGI